MRTGWVAALALGLGACASGGGGSAAMSDALRDTTWTIVEIQGEATDAGGEGRAAELAFLEDDRFAGSAGCNRVLGAAVQDGAALRLTPGPMTRMACPEPLASRETAFVAALGAVTRHRKSGDTVELLAGERVVLRLAPKPVAAP